MKLAMLSSPSDSLSSELVVGNEVSTIFGRGKVTEVRHDSQIIVVKLTSWRLAGRSTVTCYLSLTTATIQVLPPKKLYEMSVFEKVDHAQQLKEQASALFSSKKFEEALHLYARAVDAVRYVQHDKNSTNELRADLLVVMITCCNNAATCCLHLKEWDRAHKFGKNALVLLDALYEKRGNSHILNLLNREGLIDSKLFGIWMVKSYLVIARGLAEKHDTAEAMDNLKKAQEMITKFKTDGDPMFRQLQNHEKEVRKLFGVCKDRLKAEREIEKKRALAMFNKNEEGTNDTPSNESSNLPLSSNGEEAVRSTITDSRGRSVSSDSTVEHGRGDGSAARTNKPANAKKRVSFADGSIPGEVDDNDEPSFLDEHKEALFLIGGMVLGSLCVHYFLSKRRY